MIVDHDLVSSTTSTKTSRRPDLHLYYLLFFLSGFPALLYQIVWQSALFTIYGTNIESVTIIVTVFMLGLGLGSLAGGKLSIRSGLPLLRVFGLIELGIGAFGVVSLNAFHLVASFTTGASTLETGGVTFLLLLIPTLLMGGTLPLLVGHFVRQTGNVGESVGLLYSANTFGSAVACFAAALFIMRALGQSGSLRLAALFNVTVGVTALLIQARRSSALAAIPSLVPDPVPFSGSVPFGLSISLAAAAGFISLAYEIIWYRLYSFASGGAATCFAQLLGAYLTGIAYGSLTVRDLCRKKLRHDVRRTLNTAAVVMVWANVVGFLLGPALGRSAAYVRYSLTFPLVFIGASLLGAVFPLLSHAAIDPERRNVGVGISYLYLGNIVGSVLGSFVVGFILMDYLPTRTISAVLLASGAALAVILAVTMRPIKFTAALVTGLAVSVALIWCSEPLFFGMYERLLLRGDYTPGFRFLRQIENRSGVIAVTKDGTVFGGGVYDGRFNTNLVNDTNGIVRAYAIASFHPSPKRVLMVGLSSGSWAQVIANHPQVEKLTIIEINPGYLQLIPTNPTVASLLHNPKVEIIVDDGRRWLVHNPEKRFDLVVSNTSFHWRAHVSNLLSIEFLRLIRSHLNPGGIHFYNTTFSEEALLTGATEFPYSLRVGNFLAVSDDPILVDKQRWAATLNNYSIDGKPIFDPEDPVQLRSIAEVLSVADTVGDLGGNVKLPLESGASLRKRLKGKRLVTDDNMGTEWL
jgi:spermidine synthase